MAKTKTVYFCTECGNETPKWQGKCPACGQWNTFKELRLHTSSARNAEVQARHALTGLDGHKAQPVPLRNVSAEAEPRIDTHDAELNRVLGGGLVPGSLVLLGGEPGIGKSMIAKAMAELLPPEELQDILIYPNLEDSNNPLVGVMPAGQGAKIIETTKKNVKGQEERKRSCVALFPAKSFGFLSSFFRCLAFYWHCGFLPRCKHFSTASSPSTTI